MPTKLSVYFAWIKVLAHGPKALQDAIKRAGYANSDYYQAIKILARDRRTHVLIQGQDYAIPYGHVYPILRPNGGRSIFKIMHGSGAPKIIFGLPVRADESSEAHPVSPKLALGEFAHAEDLAKLIIEHLKEMGDAPDCMSVALLNRWPAYAS